MVLSLRERDKEIVHALETFRVMERQDIEALFFSHLKSPTTQCNRVMLRLKERGYVVCDQQGLNQQYLYHPSPRKITQRSKKLNHYLGILRAFISLKEILLDYIDQKNFTVEPRFTHIDKEYPQPDALFTFSGKTFFLEYQIQNYNTRLINQKMKKYVKMSQNYTLINEQFNGEFPKVWILAEGHSYKAKLNNQYPFVVETNTVDEFIEYLLPFLIKEPICQA